MPCVVSAVKFATSELVLKDITPLLVDDCACFGLTGIKGPNACCVVWTDRLRPRSVASPEADRKKFRNFSEKVKNGRL